MTSQFRALRGEISQERTVNRWRNLYVSARLCDGTDGDSLTLLEGRARLSENSTDFSTRENHEARTRCVDRTCALHASGCAGDGRRSYCSGSHIYRWVQYRQRAVDRKSTR